MISEPAHAKRWGVNRGVIEIIMIAAAIGAAVLCFGSLRSQSKDGETPIACDDFGYYRQAQLFREKGPIGGLDTAITDPLSLALVAIAKSTGRPVAQWQEPVAPHCHHYKQATDRIILQYPPGTGYAFALLPEGTRGRLIGHIVSLSMLAALLIVLAIKPTLLAAFGVTWLAIVFFIDKSWLATSWSIMPSLTLMIGLAAITATRFDLERPDLRWHALAGLILGLSINFRIPNGFLLAGFLSAYALAFFVRPGFRSFIAPICFGVACVAGTIPTFAANAINAGHPFASTYSAVDSSLPVLTWSSFVDGLTYYAVTFRKSGLFVLSAVIPVIALVMALWRRFDRKSAVTLLIVTVDLVTNLGYFLLHDPRAIYYPAPVAIFAASASVFALLQSQRPHTGQTRSRHFIPALLVIFAVIVAGATMRSRAVSPLFTDPAANPDFGDRTIVWADLTASYVNYFKHRQAAKLTATSFEMQDALVRAVQNNGYDQVLIAEPGNMTATVERLSAAFPIRKTGRAYGYDTYVIEASKLRPVDGMQR